VEERGREEWRKYLAWTRGEMFTLMSGSCCRGRRLVGKSRCATGVSEEEDEAEEEEEEQKKKQGGRRDNGLIGVGASASAAGDQRDSIDAAVSKDRRREYAPHAPGPRRQHRGGGDGLTTCLQAVQRPRRGLRVRHA